MHGLPAAFDTGRRPWISPDAAAPQGGRRRRGARDPTGDAVLLRAQPRAADLRPGSRPATGRAPAGPADLEPPTRTNDNRQISTFR
ncbi:hypothetical protein [Kitasatospora sp. NPDC093102]|uniref:hypothetical protein n=1 Tax=Kitasatospora sp. NPDC093102 TaxID=3155069 RepID=UPI003426B5CE